MSSYISYLSPASWTRAQKNKSDLEKTNPTNPVLKDEDEEFLTRITSQEGVAPPLPERKDGGLSKIEPSVIGDDGEEKEVSGEQKEKAVEVAKDEGLEGPAVVPEKAVDAKSEKPSATKGDDETKNETKVDDNKEDETKVDGNKEGKDDEQKVDLEQSDVVDGAAVKTDKTSEEEPKTEKEPVVEDEDIHNTDESKPARDEDKEDAKSDDKTETKADDKSETTSPDKAEGETETSTDKSDDKTEDKSDDKTEDKSDDKTEDKPDDKTEDKPDDKTEDKSDDKTEGKSDDKTEGTPAGKDAKPTKKWASYIPSIPSIPIPNLTKKKDTASSSTKEEPKAEESKAEEPNTDDTPASPTSPKAKKSKKDPFPTQEEAEATTTAGTSQSIKDTKQPTSPIEPTGRQTEDVSNQNTRTWASYIPNISRNNPSDSLDSAIKKGKAKEDPLKNPDGSQTDDEKEVSVLLDNLNLSAINNRVFSFSKQSQGVYEDFTVVLKDIVNGGPTAYEDLEKLIKDNEGQLDTMFGNMPPFVQTLVKSLPSKFAGSLGPEVLAAMSAKPGNDLKVSQAGEASSSSTAAVGDSTLQVPEGKKKQKRKIPGIKALVSEQGAVASMLRSILAFLKTRFPAFVTGTNVLMSLAVFILLFVFWYCHKRGKEVRLLKAKEGASADASEIEESDSDLDESNVLEKAQRDYPEVEEDKWIKEKEAEGKDEKTNDEEEGEEKKEEVESKDEKSTEAKTEEKTEANDETPDTKAADVTDDKEKEEEAVQEDEELHTTSTSKPAKEEDEAEKATS